MAVSTVIPSNKILIGIVGEKGSGKETFAKFLTELSSVPVSVVRSSDVLSDTLALWGIPKTRVNLQHLAIIMNDQYGDTSLSDAVASRIAKDSARIAVFDGVRWASDERLVRSAAKNLLVYIQADTNVRFERSRKRGEKAGEADMTYEQFLREDKEKTELLIKDIGSRADVTIENSKNIETFKREVERVYAQHIAPLLKKN